MNASDLFSLDGRVVAITGTTRGIGHALAVGLANAGADLALIDRSKSVHTARAVTALERRVINVSLDMENCTLSDCQQATDRVISKLGSIDVLINNAGIVGRGTFLTTDLETAESVIQTDLVGPLRLLRAVGNHLVDVKRGKVVNIASVLSFQGGVGVTAYATAKHGLVGLTRALANEWAPAGVCVNAIAPGYIATSINKAVRNDASRSAEITARIPAGRWGTPDDIVGAAIFLSSAASDYVTGSVIAVDGGWLAR